MKIGILTFHRCINYGSYWQTKCLAEGLQKLGNRVSILDHHSKRVNLAEWKCAMQPVLPTPVPETDYPLYRQKIEKFFSVFCSLPLSRPFPLEDPSQMEEYDAVVVGSDEVWNLSHPWYGYYPIFYGEGIRAKRLISYAASFGNYDVTWKPDQDWVNKLSKFDRISVRDENSRTIIRNVLGFEPEMVIDPCLLYPVSDGKGEITYNRPYAAIYGHNFSPFFIRQIRKWADQRKLPLVSIGYRNEWADEQWLTADPHDFASFITRSEAVITNFFHGCIFALINQKPLACETTPYRSHKVQDLLKRVDGEKYLVNEETSAEQYKTILGQPPDEHILQTIASLRKISNDYLTRALEPEYSKVL